MLAPSGPIRGGWPSLRLRADPLFVPQPRWRLQFDAPVGQVGNLSHEQVGELSRCKLATFPRDGRAGETLPAEAYTGAAGWQAVPQAAARTNCQWSPPGIRQPWPEDEYLCDGGDQGKPVGINAKKQILGLKMEDTVAHYDTLDGRTVVEPSNEVCLYSPRFGAVRQVVSLRPTRSGRRLPAFTIRKSSTPRPPFRYPRREAEHPGGRRDRRPAARGHAHASRATA